MRSTLTTISVLAVLATSAGPAAARLDGSLNPSAAAPQAKATGIQGRQYRHLGGDVTSAASASKLAPAPIVRVARAPSAHSGFAWADAGIGAGLASALWLSVAGVSSLRRQRPTPTV